MNFDEITLKVKKFGKDTMTEVQKLNDIRVLNNKVNDSKKQINNIYIEIGKKIYEQYKEEALSGFESEITGITEKLAVIEELKEQIRKVKGVVVCPCCNMDVPATEAYCSNCGSKMPEIEVPEEETEDEATDVVEEAVETVEEVAEEAAEAVAEAAEEVAEEITETAEDKAEA